MGRTKRRHFMTKCYLTVVTALITLAGIGPVSSQSEPHAPAYSAVDLYQDTWVASDALGRQTPTSKDTGLPRPDRTVGMFYFVWHGKRGGNEPLYDNSKIINDPTHDKFGPLGAFHWWGEPAVGYFHADDPWVARKNLIMLSDAGVDVLFFDATNAYTYPEAVSTLCHQAEFLRSQGERTPQIAFLTHSRTGFTVTKLYNELYSKGLYSNLWFHWHGDPKPLILGDKAGKNDDGTPLDQKIADSFTWRQSWAWDPGQDKWQWIDNSPQRFGWHDDPAKAEEVPVSVAGHPVTNIGRSRSNNIEPPLNDQLLTQDTSKGDYFSEQWTNALKIGPEFIFVTGWNEWIAQRFTVSAGQKMGFVGRSLGPGDSFFVDNYDEEFSRDIMPMQGGYGDDYYMQLVDGIRRYKGARPTPVQHGFIKSSLTNQFAAWSRVSPEFRSTVGGAMHRNWDGWGALTYVNNSGRNEIAVAKVACDRDDIYFYVRTVAAITSWDSPNWMQLLIETDQNSGGGWDRYDYIVNSHVLSGNSTMLTRFSDGKTATVKYRASGNQMVVVIPRRLLGLTNTGRTTFDFHWVDNSPAGPGANPADWWYDGDSAPDGRFNYRYINVP